MENKILPNSELNNFELKKRDQRQSTLTKLMYLQAEKHIGDPEKLHEIQQKFVKLADLDPNYGRANLGLDLIDTNKNE